MLLLTSCNLTGGVTAETNECSTLEGTSQDNCYLEQKKCSLIENEIIRNSCIVDLAKATKKPKV